MSISSLLSANGSGTAPSAPTSNEAREQVFILRAKWMGYACHFIHPYVIIIIINCLYLRTAFILIFVNLPFFPWL